MNKMDLFEAVNLIDDDIVREAEISSETKASTSEEPAITVSGVEVRNSIRWQRIAAIASAFILMAGLGSVGAMLYNQRPTRHTEPPEVVIPAATESTTVTEDKKTEVTDADRKEKDKIKKTKESNNTAATSKANEENKPAAVTSPDDNDEQPVVTENNAPDEKQTTEPARTAPAHVTTLVCSTPRTSGNVTISAPAPVTTAKTTTPNVTEAITTEQWQIHLPCTIKPSDPNITWRAYQCTEMFDILRSLTYTPDDNYSMPNSYLIDANDNNRVYALNFEYRWILKYGTDGTDWGYAPMPDRLYELFCG